MAYPRLKRQGSCRQVGARERPGSSHKGLGGNHTDHKDRGTGGRLGQAMENRAGARSGSWSLHQPAVAG